MFQLQVTSQQKYFTERCDGGTKKEQHFWPNIKPLISDKSNLNKANLRDLIAATDVEFLLKLDSNHGFFGPYDLEI